MAQQQKKAKGLPKRTYNTVRKARASQSHVRCIARKLRNITRRNASHPAVLHNFLRAHKMIAS
jgi:hypothetical protein